MHSFLPFHWVHESDILKRTFFPNVFGDPEKGSPDGPRLREPPKLEREAVSLPASCAAEALKNARLPNVLFAFLMVWKPGLARPLSGEPTAATKSQVVVSDQEPGESRSRKRQHGNLGWWRMGWSFRAAYLACRFGSTRKKVSTKRLNRSASLQGIEGQAAWNCFVPEGFPKSADARTPNSGLHGPQRTDPHGFHEGNHELQTHPS